MSLKARVDKLHGGLIADVRSKITVKKDDKIIKQSVYGKNSKKEIELIVKL